jgi:hypothetical protein
MFVPLGILTTQLNIHQEWDQQNKLYSLSGKELMKTPMMENVEDLDRVPVDNENAFNLLSYKLSVEREKIHLTITAKNVTGKKLDEGIEDLNTTFIFNNSTVTENRNRNRPSIDKDETVIRSKDIPYPGTIENKKIIRGELEYILFEGRTLKW